MSPDMAEDIQNAGCPENKILVHYYGSETNEFYHNHEYKSSKPVRFLIISGLVPQKGHLFLLEAFRKAYQINQNIILRIVGTGPLKNKIESVIQKYSMELFVFLKSRTTYASKEHKKYFDEADVFIHPSVTDTNGDKEGIPGAIVEAMAAGLPVISTCHAGIPYIINNGKTGLLVKEWDIEALKNAILKIASDSTLRRYMGKNGQEYAINNLDLKIKEKELENIYQSLIIK
jgi:colanic acid/amylovoran biosynthesis glycosyltransferase